VWINTDDVRPPLLCHLQTPTSKVLMCAQVHIMLRALLSVQHNSPDARSVIFLHVRTGGRAAPGDLEFNARLLDKAFPDMAVECVRFCPLRAASVLIMCRLQPVLCRRRVFADG
jgi:hypothetical protein